MTVTIDLTPAEELSLGLVARQSGLNLAEAARKTLTAHLPPVAAWYRQQYQGGGQENLLLQERDSLLARELSGTLSDAQAIRLHQVESLLDALEDQDPVEQEADRRFARTGDQLDEILTLLRSLPRRGTRDAPR